jgi:hypothetical protein
MSNFVRILVLSLMLSGSLFAEAVPFSVSAVQPTPEAGKENSKEAAEDAEATLISQLKQQAIADWLQGYLGNRYSVFEKLITKDFAEKYVLDYSISRSNTTPPNLVVSGHLDSDALKRWARIADSKKGGNQLSAILFMSSSVPGLTFGAQETATKTKEITVASTLYNLLSPTFSHSATRLNVAQTAPSAAPKLASEVHSLRDYLQGANAAVWVELSPVSGSSGVLRVDIYGYNSDRILFALSEDIAVANPDFANPEYLKTALNGIAQNFRAEWESATAEGRLNSVDFRIIHEGLSSYRDLKLFESALSHQDFVNQLILRRAAFHSVEFEFGTALNNEEVAERLVALQPGNRPLKVSKIDSRTIVIR